MSEIFSRASDYLSENGPFWKSIDGYQVRDEQQALCTAIESMLATDSVLTAEAGTGIGKTFAYLIPAILSGKKIIVSTGTRHLQDQLFHGDIPRVVKALDVTMKAALLKGRSNYLCLHRLNLAPHLGFMNRESQSYLAEINHWAKSTETGDISELASVPEDALVWVQVTSTADNCLGGECDLWSKCHVVQARKKAQDADVLVINHHLLLADMTLKEDGFAELLPGADAFIIDEAHQLHDVASRYFGNTISSRQILMLSKDTIAEQVNDAPDMKEIRDYAEDLEKASGDFRIALGDSNQRSAWNNICHKPSVKKTLDDLIAAILKLSEVLEVAAARSRGLEQCYERCMKSLALIRRFLVKQTSAESDDDENAILWYETFTRSFMLHSTPVDLAELFRSHTDDFSSAWLFTSATLQVNKNFTHFSNRIGLQNHETGVWDSPFDYQKQSLLYLPDNMPEPSDRRYISTLLEKVKPVIEASGGRAFLLFTSYRAMHEAAEKLEGEFDYPLFVQGELPKHQLLDEFRKAGNGLLLGTSSFWEGVDVRGGALSCVIIDKLPFASPGDPVMQARIDSIKKSGGQPFMEYQIPQAAIALKQGVGRLIRDVKDHGVVVIGDPRLTSKAYGRVFLNSLPPMRQTSDIDDIKNFYAENTMEDDVEAACT